jgi:enoyl-CoA hydratase
MEQQITPHAVHPHSKHTAYYVEAHKGQPAVTRLNQGLADGTPLVDYFTAALRSQWPDFAPQEPLPTTLVDGVWVQTLPDFAAATKIESHWQTDSEPWQTALVELTAVYADSILPDYLKKLCGTAMDKPVTVVPTVVYPMLEPVLVETADTLYMILPPAKAWGESPPWPFGEDPGWVMAQSCFYLVRHFLRHTLTQLDETQRGLLTYGAVTLCLEEEFDEAEAMTYLVQKKKEQKLPDLPAAVAVLRDYLAAPEGRTLFDLPTFRRTMSEQYILTRTEGRVGIAQLNRPKALNALNSDLMMDLMDACEAFDADANIGCIVITGNERAFAAGADIKQMAGATPVTQLDSPMIDLWDRLRKVSKPVIAAVSGYALGGGCELAMLCDMIVASETAQFGQPEINIGVIPGAGGTQRMTRAVGKALAMEIVLNGRFLTAAEAAQHGLVNRVVPVEVYLEAAIKMAAEIAARAPVAIRLGKEAVNMAFETTLEAGVGFERRLFYMLFATEDQKEGMDAFINKRKPEWKGK